MSAPRKGTPARIALAAANLAGPFRPFVAPLGRGIVVAAGVALLAFALIRLIPGDPAVVILGDQATPERLERLREVLGLAGTLPEQLVRYFGGLVRGDLGTSLATGGPVSDIVARSLPVTLALLGLAFALSTVVAVPIALVTALPRGEFARNVFRVLAAICIATPVFFTSVVAILVFSIGLGLAPVGGYSDRFPDALRYLWVPALVLSIVLSPLLARVLQSTIRHTMTEEFVETAIARGLSQRRLLVAYVLRPSVGPTIALLGYLIGTQLGAAVIVEYVFNLPGIGTALVQAVAFRDYPAVQGIVVVFGLTVVFANSLAAAASGWLDPRTRRNG